MSDSEAQDKQHIVPHLWFDKEAKEAAEFYASVFPDSAVTSTSMLHDTPSGDTEIVGFTVMGHAFMAISAGPLFTINPSISFMINFDPSQDPDARKRIDEIWEKLMDGGRALMPLQQYDFSERYGWVQDRYGVSWQLIYTNPEGDERPLVIPAFLFTNELSGKAEEASDFYLSVFRDASRAGMGQAKRGAIARFPADTEQGQKERDVMFTDFQLLGQWFAAMDGGNVHDFGFNEAVSLMVRCKDQDAIDYYWEQLSAVPEAEQCGWLKDKYGVSWQIVPEAMDDMMSNGTPEQIERVTKAFLEMKKCNLKKLEIAYEQ